MKKENYIFYQADVVRTKNNKGSCVASFDCFDARVNQQIYKLLETEQGFGYINPYGSYNYGNLTEKEAVLLLQKEAAEDNCFDSWEIAKRAAIFGLQQRVIGRNQASKRDVTKKK